MKPKTFPKLLHLVKIVVFINTTLIFVSCENTKKPDTSNDNATTTVNTPISEAVCNVKNGPKLFLDFWPGMSIEEFNCIEKSLIKSRRIFVNSNLQSIYVLNFDSLILTTDFFEKKLMSLKLSFPSEGIPSELATAISDRELILPDKIVSEKLVTDIDQYLQKKYGKSKKFELPPTLFFNGNEIKETNLDNRQWIKEKLTIRLIKHLTYSYKRYMGLDSKGFTVPKTRFYKQYTRDMDLIYSDSFLLQKFEEGVYKKNNIDKEKAKIGIEVF